MIYKLNNIFLILLNYIFYNILIKNINYNLIKLKKNSKKK